MNWNETKDILALLIIDNPEMSTLCHNFGT